MNEIKITIPEGMEIDEESSTFECIKFKPKSKLISIEKLDNTGENLYYWNREVIKAITASKLIDKTSMTKTEEELKSTIAFCKISRLLPYYRKEEPNWKADTWKYVIKRRDTNIYVDTTMYHYDYLAFNDKQERDLFLKDHKDLIKEYLMID